MNAKTSNDLKRFFLRLIIFTLIVVLLDRTVGKALKILYYAQNHGDAYNATYALEKANQEILIIGASTAQHNYIPKTFEDSLNLSCFNSGRGGINIFYFDAVLKCGLKRYLPNIVILDLRINEMQFDPDLYDRISILLPYYDNHPELRNIIMLKSPYEKIKMLSSVYPYNSTVIPSLTGVLDLNKKRFTENAYKGYGPLYGTIKGKLDSGYYSNVIDSNNVNVFKSFIGECAKNKVKLFIMVSPHYKKYLNQSKSTSIVEAIAAKYHVPVWDYSQSEYFLKHKEFFVDIYHLNNTGAGIYSAMIAERIKKSLAGDN